MCGTCVKGGWVPSKPLSRAPEAVHGGRAATRFPGLGGNIQLGDWAQLAASKDELVNTLRQQEYVDLLPASEGVSYIEGNERIADGALLVCAVPVEVGKVLFNRNGFV